MVTARLGSPRRLWPPRTRVRPSDQDPRRASPAGRAPGGRGRLRDPPARGSHAPRQASYAEELQAEFRGRKFADLDPPAFLDHEGTELILISASEDVREVLGIDLQPAEEDEQSADIFRDLRLRKAQQPLAPLTKGEWD